MSKAEIKKLLSTLGKPVAKKDYPFDVEIGEGEWIYPKKGITLILSPKGDKINRISVYRPKTLEYFSTYLHPGRRRVRRKRRRRPCMKGAETYMKPSLLHSPKRE